MKTTRKFMAILMVFAMILSMGVLGAFAQDVNSGKGGTATITISNASRGVTYKVVKLFDATVTGAENGSIFYTGTIPDELTKYFEVKNSIPGDDDDATLETAVDPYIVAKDDAIANGALSVDASNALKAWAEDQTPDASVVSNGTELTFTGLEYGYYVVLTSQGAGAVSVTSTNPNGSVYDKNSTQPGVVKKVNGNDSDTVTIGDTVTYTVTFTAPNYLGSGATAELVTKYVIEDTLPAFLTDVKITSVVIDQPTEADIPLTETNLGETFDNGFGDDKQITVEWATKANDDADYVSKYENGSKIVITYTAKVVSNQDIVVDGTTGNVNEVTVTAYTDDNTPDVPWEEPWSDSATIFTYAAAFRKVDENNKPLVGAEFTIKGLTAVKGANGLYEVETYEPTSDATPATLVTDDNGYIVIEGLDDDEVLIVSETKAPAGYNKLTGSVEVHPIKVNEEVKSSSGVVYYNAAGEEVAATEEHTTTKTVITTHAQIIAGADTYKVENHKGTELPSTGGMGTVIFIAVGSLIAVAAVCFLVTKKRMQNRGMN